MARYTLEQKKKKVKQVIYPKVCQEISQKTGIELEKVQAVIAHYFLTLQFFIDSPFLPRIKIGYFGTFAPHRRRLVRRYINSFKVYFKGWISKDDFNLRLEKYGIWLRRHDDDRKGDVKITSKWFQKFNNYVIDQRKEGKW